MVSLQRFSQTASRLDTGKLKPVWFDIPYHFYIAVDGKIADGRSIKFVGDTNTDYNPTGHALVVLEGNFENEEPSPDQLKSLQALHPGWRQLTRCGPPISRPITITRQRLVQVKS